MLLSELLKKKFVIFDGAMGTMLQKRGLLPGERTASMCIRCPDIVESVHRMYVDAGSDMLCTNTFGVTVKNYSGEDEVSDIIHKAVGIARSAGNGKTVTALDIGPVGEFMEPSGTLTFDEVYNMAKTSVIAGEDAGADAVAIETMTSLAELRAVILAAKENCGLPIIAMMTFDSSGRTFEGCCVESFAATANSLGVDVIGINCSLLPSELYPTAEKLFSLTELPVCIKPNAGKPKNSLGVYDMTPDVFARQMAPYASLGVKIVGGCCGTDPDYISKIAETFNGLECGDVKKDMRPIICSASSFVYAEQIVKEADIAIPIDPDASVNSYIEKDGYSVVVLPAGITDHTGSEIIRQVQAECFDPLYIISPDGSGIDGALRKYAGVAAVSCYSGNAENAVRKYGGVII